ncbi:D-xylose transport system substrate-binding protein [Loktanella sp. DSM 29012]|uniref:Substrate-binding domain-containing protein n=1 Tax=Loktanella gaetbuli TaxID=2881335 RepID=A0ABS8BRM9_9RHOB|nr:MULTISPECIES: substrate-binding domain-containing protein [Loktanella]MCB5198380.1 substrate-binding domain-containing protein [Loktanella gaetbuli]SEQ53206.1 D-xylose transport system substrate-binding protein [Loktanella sp. DSM 29012]
MNKSIIAAVIATVGFSSAALAESHSVTVGVSWSNFQEERWKTDEAAIQAALEAAGASYISADAQASAAKQLTDIEALIAQGADALIILAMDKDAIGPAIDQAAAEGIPVVGYDRLIEDERAFYLTFDNKGVGTIIAETVSAAAPEGNYAIIKGDPGDPNALFLLEGMMEVLQPMIDSGAVTIAGEAFTDGWKPENAQRNMEQILTSNDNNIDAVLSQNDGMAGGAIAALAAQGLDVPVGGQDGDLAALNRVARGTQTVSVWKNSRDLGGRAADIAVALASGTALDAVPEAQKWAGGENGVEMNAIFLAPTPITADNLNLAIDAGHISKEQACEGAMETVAACQ